MEYSTYPIDVDTRIRAPEDRKRKCTLTIRTKTKTMRTKNLTKINDREHECLALDCETGHALFFLHTNTVSSARR